MEDEVKDKSMVEEDSGDDEVDEDEEDEEPEEEGEGEEEEGEEDEEEEDDDDDNNTGDLFCFRCHRGSEGVRIVMVYRGGEIGMRGGLFHCDRKEEKLRWR